MKKSFRPTKVASKRRRDLLNVEISEIRNVLPFSEFQRQRLSQLQVMSLSSAYVLLNNFVAHLVKRNDCPEEILRHFNLAQILPGFILVLASDGRVLYATENIPEYLGYTAVELLTQGETIYDFIDKCDQSELRYILESMTSSDVLAHDFKTVTCRMLLAQNHRSLGGYSRHKAMEMKGRVLLKPASAPRESMPEAIFVAFVVPHSKPMSDSWAITSFETVHRLDMRFMELGHNGCILLGYESSEILTKSWYELMHPDDIPQAKAKHFEVLQFRDPANTSSVCARIQTRYGYFVWLQIVMIFRERNNEREIVCNNCILEEMDAVKRLNCKETNKENRSVAYSGNLTLTPTPEPFGGENNLYHSTYSTSSTCITGSERADVQTSLKFPLLKQILNRPAIQTVNISKPEVSSVESLLTPQNSPLDFGQQDFPSSENRLLHMGIPTPECLPSDFDPAEATYMSRDCMDQCIFQKPYSAVVPPEFGNATEPLSSVQLERQSLCFADDGTVSATAILDALTELQNDPQLTQELESMDLSVFCESFPELEAENQSVTKHQDDFQTTSLINVFMPYLDLSLTKLSHAQIEHLNNRLSELNKLHETMICKAVIDTLHDDTRREHVNVPVSSTEFQNLALSAECKTGFGSQSSILSYESYQSYPIHKPESTQMPARTFWI